tara:strand:+ start:3195 stop:4463 length:1269 start_codon:yes stop_codon:yes gene_type:complete
MASTYTTNNGIEKIGSGEQAGTWGTTTNANLDIIDKAINGVEAITLSGTSKTITTTDGSAASEGVNKVFVFSGSPGGTCTVTLSPNDQEKVYLIKNSSDQTVLISQGSGANASLAANETAWVFSDGAGSGAAVTKQDVSSSPAAFTVGTNLTVTGDASVGDDLSLASDGAILNFGADSDVSLTHVADTGLLLNSTRQLQFNDSTQNINAPNATTLDINATDEVEVNATLIDVNGNLDVSGTSTLTGNVTLGGQLIMPDVTDTKILIADGTSYQERSVSGDVTISNTGVATIANNAVETAMIADNQITTAKLAGSVAVIGMSAKVTVSGGNPAITASVNTSGITDSGTGDFTIAIATDYSDANYAVSATTFDDDGTNRNIGELTVDTQAADTILVKSFRPSASENSARSSFDPDGFYVMSNAQ